MRKDYHIEWFQIKRDSVSAATAAARRSFTLSRPLFTEPPVSRLQSYAILLAAAPRRTEIVIQNAKR